MSWTSTRLTCCLIKWWQSSKKFTEMQYTVVSLFVKLWNNYNFTGSHKKSSEESRFGKCPELQVGGQCRRDHLRDIFHVSLQSRRARQPLVSWCTILLPFLKRFTFSQELASGSKPGCWHWCTILSYVEIHEIMSTTQDTELSHHYKESKDILNYLWLLLCDYESSFENITQIESSIMLSFENDCINLA